MKKVRSLSVPALQQLCTTVLAQEGLTLRWDWQYQPHLATIYRDKGLTLKINLRTLSQLQRDRQYGENFCLLWAIRYLEVWLFGPRPQPDTYAHWLADQYARLQEKAPRQRLYMPRLPRAVPWKKRGCFCPWALYCLHRAAETAARDLALAQPPSLLAELEALASLPEVAYQGVYPRHSLFYLQERGVQLPEPEALAQEADSWAAGVLLRSLTYAEDPKWLESRMLRTGFSQAAEAYLAQSGAFFQNIHPKENVFAADQLAVVLRTNARLQRLLACCAGKEREEKAYE